MVARARARRLSARLHRRIATSSSYAQWQWLANLMDDAFRIPGTPLNSAGNSVLGLFPGLGDVLTSALSLLIVHHAWQTEASKLTLARMLGNVGVDFVIGAIPFLGDLFDFVWKANRKTRSCCWSSICTARRRGPAARGTTVGSDAFSLQHNAFSAFFSTLTGSQP